MGRHIRINYSNISLLLLVVLAKCTYSQLKDIRQGPPPPGGIAPGGIPPGINPEDFLTTMDPAFTTAPDKDRGAKGEVARYTIPTTSQRRFVRTTPLRISFEENCDYLAHYCLKAYNTGKLCGRTLYYTYHTFKNYCLLDYVNCMERYEVWQVVHMGQCFKVPHLTEYLLYNYDDDFFLDHYYVMEDH